jgi:hypothetical protein
VGKSGKDDTRRRRRLIFMFFHAICHELAHVFMTYLNKGLGNTPPKIGDPRTSNPSPEVGECGAYLEFYGFGGSIGYDDNGVSRAEVCLSSMSEVDPKLTA